MSVTDIDAYHKTITGSDVARSKTHSGSVWHRYFARQLVDSLPPEPDDTVLDFGMGTAEFHQFVTCRMRAW